MVEYRPVPEDRHDEFQQMVDYAFRPQDGPPEYDEDDQPIRIGDLRGLFDGDTLLTGCILQDFDARLRGSWIDLGGYTAVATPPEHRRSGHVETLLRESMREYRDRDIAFVGLWPFKRSFYRQFGWETANKYVRYEIEPDALAFAADAVDDSGTFWNASADDWRRLREVELAHGAGTSLTLRRSRQWWHHRVFERFGDERYVYAWDDEHGETAGYLVYTVDGDHGDRTLEVAEASYRSEEAYLQLLGFLYRHDSQVSEIELYRCCGTDMLDRVADTTDIECEIDAGPMIRVADVPAALERVPYPDGVSGSTTIAVTDPLLEAGNGTVRLDVEDGEAECRPAPDAGQADVETGVGTLSQLVVGYHDVQDAERLGSLSCADDEVRETFDRLFPPETVCLRDFF